VTKSEVDITALTHWLDYVAVPEVDITAPGQHLFLLGL